MGGLKGEGGLKGGGGSEGSGSPIWGCFGGSEGGVPYMGFWGGLRGGPLTLHAMGTPPWLSCSSCAMWGGSNTDVSSFWGSWGGPKGSTPKTRCTVELFSSCSKKGGSCRCVPPINSLGGEKGVRNGGEVGVGGQRYGAGRAGGEIGGGLGLGGRGGGTEGGGNWGWDWGWGAEMWGRKLGGGDWGWGAKMWGREGGGDVGGGIGVGGRKWGAGGDLGVRNVGLGEMGNQGEGGARESEMWG